jgi:hypothetical protein
MHIDSLTIIIMSAYMMMTFGFWCTSNTFHASNAKKKRARKSPNTIAHLYTYVCTCRLSYTQVDGPIPEIYVTVKTNNCHNVYIPADVSYVSERKGGPSTRAHEFAFSSEEDNEDESEEAEGDAEESQRRTSHFSSSSSSDRNMTGKSLSKTADGTHSGHASSNISQGRSTDTAAADSPLEAIRDLSEEVGKKRAKSKDAQSKAGTVPGAAARERGRKLQKKGGGDAFHTRQYFR